MDSMKIGKGRPRTGHSGEGSVCSEIPILGQNTVIDCVFENVLTAPMNEELSSNCPSQYISMTCNKRENPQFSGCIYHELNTDYK